MKQGLTELVFILDKSGSMGGLESDTIGGFNSMLAKQKEIAGECTLTTVLFDNNYYLLHDRIDIKAVSPITEREYFVGGMTALLDAIGITVNKIINVQKNTAKNFRAEKVMFVIITDGEENASREYSAEKIKTMIEQQKAERNWEFIFMGANIDAVQTAGRFGIAPNRAVDYLADKQGTDLNFEVMSKTLKDFREKGKLDEKDLDVIRQDVKNRRSKNKSQDNDR